MCVRILVCMYIHFYIHTHTHTHTYTHIDIYTYKLLSPTTSSLVMKIFYKHSNPILCNEMKKINYVIHLLGLYTYSYLYDTLVKSEQFIFVYNFYKKLGCN